MKHLVSVQETVSLNQIKHSVSIQETTSLLIGNYSVVLLYKVTGSEIKLKVL